MADLTPDLTSKLGRLLPRLASDAPGEVNATVQAIRRTLSRAGFDLHDMAARLIEAPRPVMSSQRPPANAADLFHMASWLRLHSLHRLSPKQRDFVVTASGLLASGRTLTQKQETWLRDLHARHNGGGHG